MIPPMQDIQTAMEMVNGNPTARSRAAPKTMAGLAPVTAAAGDMLTAPSFSEMSSKMLRNFTPKGSLRRWDARCGSLPALDVELRVHGRGGEGRAYHVHVHDHGL